MAMGHAPLTLAVSSFSYFTEPIIGLWQQFTNSTNGRTYVKKTPADSEENFKIVDQKKTSSTAA